MTSVFQRWFRRDPFADLLEESANAARDSARRAGEAVRRTDGATAGDTLYKMRHRGRRIAAEVSERLGRTLATPFERGHIESLAVVLGRIPGTIERFCAEFMASGKLLAQVDLPKQVALVEKATAVVVDLVRHLRRRAHPDQVKELNERIRNYRDEADRTMADDVRSLDGDPHGTLRVIAAHDLFDILQEALDRCRDAGNLVSRMALAYARPSPVATGPASRKAGLLLRRENA